MKRRRSTRAMSATTVEPLESRTMLSSASAMLTNRVVHSAAATADAAGGYTPAQIRVAYGFNQITFANGSTPDGSGQTIAIVDAYNDPKIAADLAVFDAQFGLPEASLKVVNQTGGSSLPTTNSGWAGEIAVDVEWAHAIAPGAKILLVEAGSDSTADLVAGVTYARQAAGVSVVSLSWGGSEFTTFPGSGESTSQTTYDAQFTTPAGHTNVTFVAAAGDGGARGGAEWPATSPNVLSVGGTSLYTSDSTGTYSSETAWSGTSGGNSTVESEPAFQNAVQSTGKRSAPDVAYDGDPNTGFDVYDSVTDNGVTGWQVVAGTSAGAPQWAALIAIANQGRTYAGDATLNGSNQVLPLLYGTYADPSSSNYSSYTQFFNDVTTGSSGSGRHGASDATGYDLLTGLGSPNAPAIVDVLTGVSYAGRGSGSSSGGSNSSLTASPFADTIIAISSAYGVLGSAGYVTLKISNVSGAVFKGPVSISVSLSASGEYSSNDPVAATKTYANFTLGSRGSRRITLKLNYSTGLSAGTYTPIAEVNTVTSVTAAAEAIASTAVSLSTPTVDLSPSFAMDPVAIRVGKPAVVTVRISDTGNSAAVGTISLEIDQTFSGLLDASSTVLASLANRTIKIAAGKSVVLHVKLAAMSDTPGTFDLLASLTSATQVQDSNPANDAVLAATTPT